MNNPTLDLEIAPLDRQAAFDRIYTHFVYAGGLPSIAENESCLYRDGDGNACAAGLLLPDGVYTPEIDEPRPEPEGTYALSVWRRFPQVRPYWGTEEDIKGFLNDLQGAHDTAALAAARAKDEGGSETWPERIVAALTTVAIRHSLKIPPPPSTEGAP